jgi:hypothetical protein
MAVTDAERIQTLRELNSELRSHCARLESLLAQRDEFLRSLCDPDLLGYAVNDEVRHHAYNLLRVNNN